jgi:hypothetical protein
VLRIEGKGWERGSKKKEIGEQIEKLGREGRERAGQSSGQRAEIKEKRAEKGEERTHFVVCHILPCVTQACNRAGGKVCAGES